MSSEELANKIKPGFYISKGKRLQDAILVRVDVIDPPDASKMTDYIVSYVIRSGENRGLRKSTGIYWFNRWYKPLDIEAFTKKFHEQKDRLEGEVSSLILLANSINEELQIETEPMRCIYDVCWQGRCKNQVEYEGEQFCEEHRDKMCSKCKTRKAVRDCHQHAGSMICGAPLCDECKHQH